VGQPEDRFKAKILKRLRALGGEWIPFPRTRFGVAGVSDILGCFRGRFVAIEVKRPDAVGSYGVTKTQQAFLTRVAFSGGVCFVVRDEDSLASVISTLKA
jgi:hypothetical protein